LNAARGSTNVNPCAAARAEITPSSRSAEPFSCFSALDVRASKLQVVPVDVNRCGYPSTTTCAVLARERMSP
jgi:hypothetical protein